VTNDAFAPLRAPRLSLARAQREQGRRFAARRRRPAAPQIQGRWSLTAPLFSSAPAHGPRMRAIAEILLERYGIVTRESVLAEGLEALADHVRRGRLKRLALERFDGEPVVGSKLEPLLVELGFRQGPRKLTLSA